MSPDQIALEQMQVRTKQLINEIIIKELETSCLKHEYNSLETQMHDLRAILEQHS